MSNIQYIKPQPVPGYTPYSNSQTSYPRQQSTYHSNYDGSKPMTQDYNRLKADLKPKVSKTIHELAQTMSSNAKALLDCSKLLNEKDNIDQHALHQWHEGMKQNMSAFSRNSANQVNGLKNVCNMHSSDYTKLDSIQKSLRNQGNFIPNSDELSTQLRDLSTLITTSKYDATKPDQNQSTHERMSSHHRSRHPASVENVTIVTQGADYNHNNHKSSAAKNRTPVRSRIHIDPVINLTPIRRPVQKSNPKREAIKKISQEKMMSPQQEQASIKNSLSSWSAAPNQSSQHQNHSHHTQNASSHSQNVNPSQLPVTEISGRSTKVNSGLQTPIEEPIFRDDLVNGELVSCY